MKTTTIAILVLLAVLLAASGASAYTVWGIKAQFHTLTYQLNPNFNTLTDVNAGSTAQQITAMQNGAGDWNGQADFFFAYGGQTTVNTVNTADGVNAMFYQDNVGDPVFGALAICFAFADANGFITGFDIEFYDYDGITTTTDFFYWGLPGTPSTSEFDIWAIATHEFGHALGMGHTDQADPTISMFATTGWGDISHRAIATDDRNGEIFIYGAGPYVAKFAGVGVTCPAPQNVPSGVLTPLNGFTITNTGNVADSFNWTITDGGAGVLVGSPVNGTTPLLAPGQIYNVAAQQVLFACNAVGPVPVMFTATSVGDPTKTAACNTILTPVSGAFIPPNLVNGMPTGLAWDPANNLYVADFANGQILMWNAGGYNLPGIPVVGGLPGPTGIAFAPNGNLMVLQGDGAVSEWMVPAGAPVGMVAPPGTFVMPMDLAFCGPDLFVTDPGTNAVWCVAGAGNGSGFASTPSLVAGGFPDIFGVAVDLAGNLIVTGGSTGNLYSIPNGSGAPLIIGNVLGGGHAQGVALDMAGFIYVAEGVIGADIDVFPPAGGVPIATFPTSTSGWTWIAFSPMLQPHGPLMLDTFLHTSNAGNLGPANCCAGAVCQVDVSTLGFANGMPIPSTAACAKPWPGTIYVGSPPLSGNQPSGFAFDMPTGMLYSADFAAGTVDLTMPFGGGTGQIIAGLDSPQGVALGPDNFLYVCQAGTTGTVSVFDPSGAFLHDLFPPGSLPDPVDLAWCGPDLFVTERSTGTLYLRTVAVAGPYPSGPFAYQGGFVDLFGVAVDPGGQIYVTTGSGATVEIVNPSPQSGTQFVASLVASAEGLAFDMNGDLWVADGVSGDLVQLQAPAGATLAVHAGAIDGPSWVGFGMGAFMPGAPDSSVFWSNQSGENPVPPPGSGAIAYRATAVFGYPEPALGGPCLGVTAVEDAFEGRPRVTALIPASPNPFRAAASLGFSLEHAGHVRLEVFDVAGRRVRTLVDREFPEGVHGVIWDGRDDVGRDLSPGIYFTRFQAEGVPRVGKVVMTR